MYVILSGSVSIRAQRDGHWEEIAVLGPGASVGEMSLIDSAPRSATAICTQETNVLEFASDWLVGSPPSLGVKVYQNFSRIFGKAPSHNQCSFRRNEGHGRTRRMR